MYLPALWTLTTRQRQATSAIRMSCNDKLVPNKYKKKKTNEGEEEEEKEEGEEGEGEEEMPVCCFVAYV